MADLDAMVQGLSGEIEILRGKYITRFIPANPDDGPDAFEHDVKAFALLSHAAFEEFVEGVSELMMSKISDDILLQRITVGTACLLMCYGQSISISESDESEQDTCFAFVRKAVKEAKRQHSDVLMNNHGFSLKYLRKILTPVGVNLNLGPEGASLKKLADARGTFAHSMAKSAKYGEYKKAHKVLTPEEASAAVDDCLAICARIKAQAASLMM